MDAAISSDRRPLNRLNPGPSSRPTFIVLASALNWSSAPALSQPNACSIRTSDSLSTPQTPLRRISTPRTPSRCTALRTTRPQRFSPRLGVVELFLLFVACLMNPICTAGTTSNSYPRAKAPRGSFEAPGASGVHNRVLNRRLVCGDRSCGCPKPVGAGNSAVVVDLPRCGPMLSPRVPNLVPIPGPWMQRETPGQRPRPNYGHPQDLLKAMSTDAGFYVDEALAGNESTPPHLLASLSTDDRYWIRRRVAKNASTPVETLQALATDDIAEVRVGTARNPVTPVELLEAMSADEDWRVRADAADNLRQRKRTQVGADSQKKGRQES